MHWSSQNNNDLGPQVHLTSSPRSLPLRHLHVPKWHWTLIYPSIHFCLFRCLERIPQSQWRSARKNHHLQRWCRRWSTRPGRRTWDSPTAQMLLLYGRELQVYFQWFCLIFYQKVHNKANCFCVNNLNLFGRKYTLFCWSARTTIISFNLFIFELERILITQDDLLPHLSLVI